MCLDHAISPDALAGESDFETRFVDMLNGGAMCLMTSIGHRTGLFDALESRDAMTSEELALHAGLEERYVREWLGAMVTGGFVHYDGARGLYRLPQDHAACLTRAATPNNLAAIAQYIGVLGQVEDDLVECFKVGGGVPYERFPRFHEVMAEDSGQTVLPVLIDEILPLAPGLIEKLEQGIDVLDLGCGRGRALCMLGTAFPNSRFFGFDLSEDAIRFAQKEAARHLLDNVHFVAHDLSNFDQDAEPDRFDLVLTFDAIHDQARPDRMLKGIRKTLRPDGLYLAQDIKGSSNLDDNREHPIGPLLYTISTMHCMTVSLAQGGAGLGAMWGRETAERMFGEAGFGHVEVHELPHDIQNYYYICRA